MPESTRSTGPFGGWPCRLVELRQVKGEWVRNRVAGKLIRCQEATLFPPFPPPRGPLREAQERKLSISVLATGYWLGLFRTLNTNKYTPAPLYSSGPGGLRGLI